MYMLVINTAISITLIISLQRKPNQLNHNILCIYNTDVLDLKEYPPKQITILLAFTKTMNIYLTYQKNKLICFANDSILSISIHKYQENLIN